MVMFFYLLTNLSIDTIVGKPVVELSSRKDDGLIMLLELMTSDSMNIE